MNAPSHTFPVPEPETHKLDTVTEQLRRRPAFAKLSGFVRANSWPCVIAMFALGLGIGATAKMFR